MGIKAAIDRATDAGVIVTGMYSKRRSGYMVGAFKVLRGGFAAVEVVQHSKGSRTWIIKQKGFTDFYGLQSECIDHALERLK